MTTPRKTAGKLEDKAISLMRRPAADYRYNLVAEEALAGQLASVVREAYDLGRSDCMAEVLEAYRLFIDSDDLDAFRDMLAELAGLERWNDR
jgi:hypothetical protein